MSIKSLVIAAATVAATATIASADTSYFGADQTLTEAQVLDLGLVTAENAGTVEIYDFRLGTQGALLGTTSVNAGANTDVRVDIGNRTAGDVLAVLKVGGEVVASEDYKLVDRDM